MSEPIEGAHFVGLLPRGAGKFVSMCVFQDRLLIACEWGVLEVKDGRLVPIIAQAPEPTEKPFGIVKFNLP